MLVYTEWYVSPISVGLRTTSECPASGTTGMLIDDPGNMDSKTLGVHAPVQTSIRVAGICVSEEQSV